MGEKWKGRAIVVALIGLVVANAWMIGRERGLFWGHLVLGDHAKKAKAKVGESHDSALGLAHHHWDGYMGGSAASGDH